MQKMNWICLGLVASFGLGGLVAEEIKVPSVGVYRQIDLSADNLLADKINGGDPQQAEAAFREVTANLEYHNPVLVCLAGRYQFQKGDQLEGFKKYAIGRLRLIYDIRRCADTTVRDSVQVLDNALFPTFADWVSENEKRYTDASLQAIQYFSSHEEKYDHRWINLRGLRAMGEGLGGKPESGPLSVDESTWSSIKAEIVKSQTDYFQNYETNYFIGRFGRTSSYYFDDSELLTFVRATARGDIASARKLADSGLNINSPGKNGVTPLVWTFGARNLAGVEFLLDLGADPNVVFEKSITLLSLSVLFGDIGLLEVLLQHGASVSAGDSDASVELLDNAVIYSSVSEAFLRTVLKAGANAVGTKGYEGNVLYSAIIGNDYKKALVLMEYGAGSVVSDKIKEWIRRSIKTDAPRFQDNKAFKLCVEKLVLLGIVER